MLKGNKLIIYKNIEGNIVADAIYKDETLFAENEAKQRYVMAMKDWINETDDLLKFRRKEILNNSGSISHKEAVEKAEKEFEKFRVIQDQKYISSMDEFYNKYLIESDGSKNE